MPLQCRDPTKHLFEQNWGFWWRAWHGSRPGCIGLPDHHVRRIFLGQGSTYSGAISRKRALGLAAVQRHCRHEGLKPSCFCRMIDSFLASGLGDFHRCAGDIRRRSLRRKSVNYKALSGLLRWPWALSSCGCLPVRWSHSCRGGCCSCGSLWRHALFLSWRLLPT